MGEGTELDIVRVWHEALNGGDFDGLAALLADEVEFAGPRGAGYGAAMVRDWAERAGIQMTPERWFAGGDAVVVTQQARWRDAETGEWGEPVAAASAFRVREGRVQRIARFDTVGEALAAAGLDDAAEIQMPFAQADGRGVLERDGGSGDGGRRGRQTGDAGIAPTRGYASDRGLPD